MAETAAILIDNESADNIGPDEWYAEHPAKLQVTLPDGTVKSGGIYSTADIGRFMRESGLIKGRDSSVVRDPDMPQFKTKTRQARQAAYQVTERQPTGRYDLTELERVMNSGYGQPAVLPTMEPLNFMAIGLDWVGAEPSEPVVRVQFESELGECETYYHRVFGAKPDSAVIYLVFDTRYKVNRFTPKMGSTLTKITVDGDYRLEFSGTLWAAAKLRFGVFEIVPFVVAVPAVEPDTKPDTQDEIPSYDYFGDAIFQDNRR